MRVLVTGGGGFLGRHICDQLLARGDQVRILARNDYPELRSAGVECVQGDLRDPRRVLEACGDQMAVIHTAAVPGIWGAWKHYYEINTAGTSNVIDACLRLGIPKLVYTSSPSVVFDGRPHVDADESLPYPSEESYLCSYPRSKMLAERAVLGANCRQLATVALRPHLIWGPRDNHLLPRLIARARSGRLRRVGDGRNEVSMSYVENAAAAHLNALDRLKPDASCAGKAYFINEPEPVELWPWIDELLELAGLPRLNRSISARTATRLGAVCETVYRILKLPGEPPMTRFVAAQLSQSHSYSISRARSDLGYDPQISVAEGMRRIEPELKQWASN